MLFVIVAAALLSVTDVTQAKYVYQPHNGGSIKLYELVATWDEAEQKCHSDGAVLASPITKRLQKELRALFNNTDHFIGVDARIQHDFVSIEGVLLDEMPVSDMYRSLNLDKGECLAMNAREIFVVQCTSQMPYACFKNHTEQNATANCGSNDYKFENSTGSCYKYHVSGATWSSADATCQAEGGYLAIPDDKNEADLMSQYITNKSNYAYIGLNDLEGKGAWKTIYGDPVENIFNIWYYGSKPALSKLQCGMLRPYIPADLYSISCSESYHYICEKTPTYDV